MTTASTHPLVGVLVDGRYRVLRHLADGGMATVFLATDTRLDREVALKVMRVDLAADESFVSRFRREARSTARLSHPNVVPVFDQGEDAGRVFLAMEYIEGRTAREVIDAEGALTPRAGLDLMEAVLTGLAAAHEAGYIHRDVKPENILIADRGSVKVADFGLARAVTAQTSTDDGVLFGTVAYLSPEQVERGSADARSDVYAAGLVLFELLTGTRAIEGDSPIHIAFQHVHAGVPAPSSRVPGLSPHLDKLVALATQRDPDERPRDAGEYLQALARVRGALSAEELDRRPERAVRAASGVPTMAHPRPSRTQALGADAGRIAAAASPDLPGPAPPSSPRRRRRRGRGLLLALLALLLVGAGAGYWYATAGPGGTVLVPEITGQSKDAVTSTLSANDLDLTERQAFDEALPRGQAITSKPPAGTELPKGSEVAVVFSKGPERYDVPDLSGMTTSEARDALTQERLVLGTTDQEWHPSVAKGAVISSTPTSGASLKRDATVSISVSKGPEPIDVPTVTDTTADAATTAIEDAGLKVTRAADDFSTSVPKGSVISQSPGSGTLARGEAVSITVSKGPEMVTVPKVEGLKEAAATKQLKAAGFKVSVQTFLGGPLDEVRAARPGGGSKAAKGSTVTILVV